MRVPYTSTPVRTPKFAPAFRASGRADVVALRQLDAVVAQDVVRRGHVEIEIGQRKPEQVLHAGEVDFPGAELQVDGLVLRAFQPGGRDRLDEVDRLRDARLQFRE